MADGQSPYAPNRRIYSEAPAEDDCHLLGPVKEMFQSRLLISGRNAGFLHGAGLLGAQQCVPLNMEMLVRVVKTIELGREEQSLQLVLQCRSN